MDDKFILELRIQFCQDGFDLIQKIESLLLELEKQTDEDLLDALKRELHCLKGNAKAVGFDSISKDAHEMENLCGSQFNSNMVDQLLHKCDQFREAIEHFMKTKDASPFAIQKH